MERIYLKTILNELFDNNYRCLERVYGGMMNLSYVIEDGKQNKYIVYVPNGKANKIVNRVAEKENQASAYEIGITSKNVYFDTRRGIKVNEYIEGISLDKYKGEIDYQKIADVLHLLHDHTPIGSTDYHPFDRLMIYENHALKYHREMDEYREIRDFLSRNIAMIEKSPEKVLCHNDAQKSNFILTPEGEYKLIDYEFSANNDPIYDLASFANGSIEEGEKLLHAYYLDVTPKIYRRFYLWRILISLQWHVTAIAKYYQNEGKHSKINYLNVAKYFLKNAQDARAKFLKLGNID